MKIDPNKGTRVDSPLANHDDLYVPVRGASFKMDFPSAFSSEEPSYFNSEVMSINMRIVCRVC